MNIEYYIEFEPTVCQIFYFMHSLKKLPWKSNQPFKSLKQLDTHQFRFNSVELRGPAPKKRPMISG